MAIAARKPDLRVVRRFPDCSIPLLRPFLRWAGGKQRLIRELLRFVPDSSSYARYFEPFLGAGSLFFALKPRQATIGDINAELINCYRQVAADPNSVFQELKTFEGLHCKDFFYNIRAVHPESLEPFHRAARFIYLNKAAFNGIYRVNTQGVFNVPFGPTISGLSIPPLDLLRDSARYLKRASMRPKDFEHTIRSAKAGDFVYLDPPYPPLSATSFFAHYSSGRFDWPDQQRVAAAFRRLSEKGCLVMMSNADLPALTKLYSGFHINRLNALRWVGSNGDRYSVKEVVITNYRLH